MAEQTTKSSNAGEVATNTPASSLHPKDEQIIILNRNIEKLTAKLQETVAPPRFSTGEIIAIIMLLIAIGGGVASVFNLAGRIDKVEDRLGSRIDKLDDRFLRLDETVSRSLGAPAPAHQSTPPAARP